MYTKVCPDSLYYCQQRKKLKHCKGIARSLSLDLYDQWVQMEKDGKWRFTSPTHTVLAFAKALEELKQEGELSKRAIEGMQRIITELN